MFYKLLIGLTALAFGTSSFAADAYKCKVEAASELNYLGKLSESLLTKAYEGVEFVVDVATGRMIG